MSERQLRKAVKYLGIIIIQSELIFYGVRLRGYFAPGGEVLLLPLILIIKFVVSKVISNIKNKNLKGVDK